MKKHQHNFFTLVRRVFEREIRRIMSRPIYLAASVGMMSFLTLFFLTLLDEGSTTELPIAVVDHDNSTISRRFCHEIDATPTVHITHVYATHQEAREAMQRGEIYAFLELPENLYSDLLGFRRPEIAFYTNNAYTIGATQSYKTLLTMSNLVAAAVQQQLLKARGIPDAKIMNLIQPIIIEGHPIGNPWSNYSVYLLTVLLPGILGLLTMTLTIYTLGSELKYRTSRDMLKVADGNYTAAMIGKLLPSTIFFTLTGFLLDTLLFVVLGFPVQGHLWVIYMGTFLLVIAMQAFGIGILTALPVLRVAVSVGALFGMMSFSMSGFTYPTSGMLPIAQSFSQLFPLRHYYLLYCNEAMLDGPISKSIFQMAWLVAFQLMALLCAPRLKKAFILQNFPVA